jgi:hypothetical protein
VPVPALVSVARLFQTLSLLQARVVGLVGVAAVPQLQVAVGPALEALEALRLPVFRSLVTSVCLAR